MKPAHNSTLAIGGVSSSLAIPIAIGTGRQLLVAANR